MSVIARILSRARPVHRPKDSTVEIEVLLIFCLVGLAISLLAVRFGLDIDLSAIADAQ